MNSLKDKINSNLNDKILNENLKNFASSYKLSRSEALSGLDFESLRINLNKKRTYSPDYLETLFQRFKNNAEKAGANVYQAKTGMDACKYIADVCKGQKSEYIVKSKSMTSEEIRLNDYLEKENLKPIETDLGEWILQIAGEHPSHMVMPAIHKSRKQVAEIFSKFTGREIDKDNIDEMVKIAREYLRDYYFKAGVGITGANVAVAETGAVATVTNEGNARLTTTVPPVHIVLLGYEKLVEDFETAFEIINLLPKSATGQNISTYVTWMKGCYPSSNNPTGVKEVHYVFLDNGRLAFFQHPEFREALKCIRCGSCANICPPYEMIGGHVFGHIYIGAIGLILTALYHGEERAKDILKLCIGCKACSSICPAGIDLQGIISKLKMIVGKDYGINPVKKAVYSAVIPNPGISSTALKTASYIQKPLVAKDGKHLKSIPLMPKNKDFRTLPTVAPAFFSEKFKKHYDKQQDFKKKVLFYPGCAVQYFYPEMGESLVKILNKASIKVDIPDKSVCCGLPAIASGDGENGKKTIQRNLKQMGNPTDYDAYIVLCPSCGMAIKEEFPEFTADNPDLYKLSADIAQKTLSLGMFLEKENISVNVKNGAKVTYHTPCHQGRGLGFSAEKMLKEILGSNFVELEDSDVCCGFGGTYSIDFAEISSGILDKKIEHIIKTGAEIVVTDCPGCIMQIEGGLLKKGINKKVVHLSTFIEENLEIV